MAPHSADRLRNWSRRIVRSLVVAAVLAAVLAEVVSTRGHVASASPPSSPPVSAPVPPAVPPTGLRPLAGDAVVIVESLVPVRDRFGEPVRILLEATAGMDGGEAPSRWDAAAVDADPAAWFGRAVVLAGRLEQRAAAPEGIDADEWFVRTDDGSPVLVLIADPPAATPGGRVTIRGRYAAAIELHARDDRRRPYPVVVSRGELAAVVAAGDTGAASVNRTRLAIGALMLALAATLTVLLVARSIASRSPARRRGDHAGRRGLDATDDDGAPPRTVGGADDGLPDLPREPDLALAELRRRVVDADGVGNAGGGGGVSSADGAADADAAAEAHPASRQPLR